MLPRLREDRTRPAGTRKGRYGYGPVPGSAGGGAAPAGAFRRPNGPQMRLKHHRPSASAATATEAATVADLPGAAPS
ncbi:hypothetical protein EES44_27900 [Streptomyces sp. ADI96-15]|nr:hypothetical protein EES44_27900 [Streptomyces sp. ADI96-15]